MRTAIYNFLKSRKLKIFLLVVILLLLSIPVFLLVRFHTDARLVFREAKNVKLALQMYEIDAYANNRSIFDSRRKDGMREGMQQDIRNYLDLQDCNVTVTAYDNKTHEVLGFIYERKHFQIVYEYTEKSGDTYKLNYILHIKTYDGE